MKPKQSMMGALHGFLAGAADAAPRLEARAHRERTLGRAERAPSHHRPVACRATNLLDRAAHLTRSSEYVYVLGPFSIECFTNKKSLYFSITLRKKGHITCTTLSKVSKELYVTIYILDTARYTC